MPNFFDKYKHILHYEHLKLYMRQLLKLKKIHRVLESNKIQWLKHVEFSTQKRIKMENLRNRFGVRLVSNEKDYLK